MDTLLYVYIYVCTYIRDNWSNCDKNSKERFGYNQKISRNGNLRLNENIAVLQEGMNNDQNLQNFSWLITIDLSSVLTEDILSTELYNIHQCKN